MLLTDFNGHSGRNLKCQNGKRNTDSGGLTHEVLEGNKDSVGTELEAF